MVHYSLASNWAVGLHTLTFKDTNQTFAMLQSNFLFNRWNSEDSQANLYGLLGIGEAISHVGILADWETRQWYSLFQSDYYSAPKPTVVLEGRLGMAPYLGEFYDLHTWLIAQVEDVIVNNSHTVTVIPVIRFFKDNVLVEAGSNFSGGSLINAMIHF
jgi:hypothetical protein